jgi:Tol biopolymer transport system component
VEVVAEHRRAGHLGRVLFGLSLGLILGALLAGFLLLRVSEVKHAKTEPPPTIRFRYQHPAEFGPARIEMPALSRDGRRLAYVASSVGTRCIFVHDLSTGETLQIPETRGASGPFFSPGGDWLAFFHFDLSKLKKVSLKGGRPVTLADSQVPIGGLWGDDNFIYYTENLRGGLMRVSADGGPPEKVTTLDAGGREMIHTLPGRIPDSRTLLVTRAIGNYHNFETAPFTLGAPGEFGASILDNAGYARATSSGHIVYFKDYSLLASRFDTRGMKTLGPHVSVVGDLGLNQLVINVVYLPQFDISENGTLVYVAKSLVPRKLVWVTPDGTESPYSDTPMAFRQPHLSPDGRRLAVTIDDTSGSTIWIGDVDRGTFSRLTFEGHNFAPVWSPDGGGLVFTSTQKGLPNLYFQPVDGSEPARQLTQSPYMHVATTWRPGSDEIGFIELTPANEGDLRMIRFGEARGESNGEELLPNSPFDESKPVFSPNGRWLAYESNESGSTEIYVRPYPSPGGKIPISNRGGIDPRWSPDGRRLFYWEGRAIMAVDVDSDGPLDPSIPRKLIEGDYWGDDLNSSYDISPIDGRLLFVKPDGKSNEGELTIIVNWFEHLRRLLPAGDEP